MKAFNSPWVNTPLEWCCSPGWTVTLEGSSAASHSMFLSCQKTATPRGCWPPAAWSPSSSLWHKRSEFGRWQPSAQPCVRSSSQSLRRSEWIPLQKSNKNWAYETLLAINYINTKSLCLGMRCYLGCNPSFQFWHLGRLDLRCRTSSIMSCLSCLPVETVKSRGKTRINNVSVLRLVSIRIFQKHSVDQWSAEWSSRTPSQPKAHNTPKTR